MDAYVEWIAALTIVFVLTFVDDLPVFKAPQAFVSLMAVTIVLALIVTPEVFPSFVLFSMLAARSYLSATLSKEEEAGFTNE
jgi:hypothetical protein